jgi:hypothetical protein
VKWLKRCAGPPPLPFLVLADVRAGTATLPSTDRPHRRLLRQVARRSMPRVIEATIVPAILFYTALMVFGFSTALAAALCWSYGALACRRIFRRPIPPILMLAVLALTLRTLVAVASGSAFIYFLQPILGTTVVAGIFGYSIISGRPLVGRMAMDFCPIAPEVAARPGVVRLFTGLTALWAGVNLVSALTTLALLVTLPLAPFVITKTIASLSITVFGIVMTVMWCLRTARSEGLVPARAVTTVLAA